MMYLYAARNFSTLAGLASPEPMANMYDAAYFRATWILTALDAGFWTAMKIKSKWLRDLSGLVFSVFYMIAAERADEKVRKVRGTLTVEHLRISWNKGTSPYLAFFQNLMRPRFTRWPPRAIRIPRPSTSDYKEPVSGWLYYDGPISDLEHINKMILDIPGGGFVAMDPRCNDDKLFAWAGKTGLPVLSLDYKKAPEYPYPYALNECFDVYTTIIRSKGRCIGMSGLEVPKVVLTGDSAGGNLATAMTLMVIESMTTNRRPSPVETELPIPDGLVLLYPGLDMNIGNWMSDEQMSLIKDRRMRGTNKDYLRDKNMQYNDLVGTPHQSDDEDGEQDNGTSKVSNGEVTADKDTSNALKSPQPAYSHANRQSWSTDQHSVAASKREAGVTQSVSHRSEPMRTRLAMASMISYFNDRVLTPEMMRAMIILYIGPHNRPDFSQDYLLSPILAPDFLLQRFPKTYFLTGERDPLVDDTVIFAGRLRRAKRALHNASSTQQRPENGVAQGIGKAEEFDEKDVAEVILIPGISHGFTQFPLLYPPAWKLIDRCARWAAELLSAAETRDQARKQRLQLEQTRLSSTYERQKGEVNGGDGAHVSGYDPRHHRRVESSGDEDRPLEISMTRMRGRTTSDEAKRRKDTRSPSLPEGGNETARDTDPGNEEADGDSTMVDAERRGNRRTKRGKLQQKHRGHTRTSSTKSNRSLVRLDSSDDLLGRRMQGLAGPLTGLRDDDD